MISLKKILCPIDHSDCSKEALKYAVSFAMKDEAKLYLLHIIDIRTFNDRFRGNVACRYRMKKHLNC